MEGLPERRNPRLRGFDYGAGNWYFITIVARDRKRIFGTVRASVGADHDRPAFVELFPCGKIAADHLRAIPDHFPGVTVETFVVMPDHVHMILGIGNPPETGRIYAAPTVPKIIAAYKASVSRRWGTPVWQRSFYDHVIRNRQDYEEIWQYIANNPQKWFLEDKR